MRSHHRQPDPPQKLSSAAPVPLTPDLAEFLILEAAFVTAPSMLDYWHCQTCGAAGSFGETVASTRPRRSGAEKICWNCLVAILLHRRALVIGDYDVPALYGSGTTILCMAPLRKARQPVPNRQRQFPAPRHSRPSER